jgi:hypothetical protein
VGATGSLPPGWTREAGWGREDWAAPTRLGAPPARCGRGVAGDSGRRCGSGVGTSEARVGVMCSRLRAGPERRGWGGGDWARPGAPPAEP